MSANESFVKVIEDFHGVYLLCSKSEVKNYYGRTYVGYTVDPNRRIKQHNRVILGGAKQTSKKGPWEMVMIIHGFPNNISALRFEWAWQKPSMSRRLKMLPGINRKKSGESNFEYNFRILSEMLSIGPWNRLPLTIRWLNKEYVRDFPCGKSPPLHMIVCCGRIKIRKKPKSQVIENERLILPSGQANDCYRCYFCHLNVTEDKITCINPNCKLQSHMGCLANTFLEGSAHYVPIDGYCPICEAHLLWGDLMRKLNGCSDLVADDDDYANFINDVSGSDNDSDDDNE